MKRNRPYFLGLPVIVFAIGVILGLPGHYPYPSWVMTVVGLAFGASVTNAIMKNKPLVLSWLKQFFSGVAFRIAVALTGVVVFLYDITENKRFTTFGIQLLLSGFLIAGLHWWIGRVRKQIRNKQKPGKTAANSYALWLSTNEQILSNTMAFYQRLRKETKWDSTLQQKAVGEYKKFLVLAATQENVCPSGIIDEVWHCHLLFTKEYRRFCNLLGGFIDHCPSEDGKGEKKLMEDLYAKTLIVYKEVFSMDPPQDIWPPQGADSSAGSHDGKLAHCGSKCRCHNSKNGNCISLCTI